MADTKVALEQVTFEWKNEFTAAQRSEIVALFNASLELDDNIGFSGPVAPNDAFFQGLWFDLGAARKQSLVCRAPGDAIVAMLLLARDPQPNCRHLAQLSKCIVHPSYRGIGLVGPGLRALLSHCRSAGIEVLQLDVRKGSRAEMIWTRLGFRPFGELEDYARVGGQTHAGVFMCARVDELVARDAERAAARVAAAPGPA